MNITSKDHLLEYFPNANVQGFNDFYFSRGDNDSVAFVAIKGKRAGNVNVGSKLPRGTALDRDRSGNPIFISGNTLKKLSEEPRRGVIINGDSAQNEEDHAVLEGLEVFVRGDYNQDSLERRVFGLAQKYALQSPLVKDDIGLSDFADVDVRPDLIYDRKKLGETGRAVIFVGFLVLVELLALVLARLIGTELKDVRVLAVMLGLVDIVIFFVMKAPRKPPSGVSN